MARAPFASAAVGILVLAGCSSGTTSERPSSASTQTRVVPSPSASPSSAPSSAPTSTAPSTGPSTAPDPVSIPAYFDRSFSGGDLRLGQVRERTAEYTSYDVTYRSQRYTISGVVDVPRGTGPFPAVVLAHGYIDPAVYVRGQGMTRERGVLARADYVALHVDYRNHAESDDEPRAAQSYRLGYAVDVINAVNALRTSGQVPVADQGIALMGRSMGGGVVLQALEMAPDLVDAAVVNSGVSSNEADNYRQYAREGSSTFWDAVRRRWGTPASDPAFYAGVSPRTYLSRITKPVLLNHGTRDTTCPPRWARATYRAMTADGLDVRLRWYEGEEHAFGPRFEESMRDSFRFLDQHLVRP